MVRFGGFSLDLDAAELLCNGAPISIRATPLRVLVAHARRIGQIVPKQQLLDEVWPNVAVTDASLSTALRERRQTLGDDGRRQQLIQTLRHRGVRLVQPRSETRRPEPAATADGVAERHQALLARLGATLFDGGHQDEARAADVHRGLGLVHHHDSIAARERAQFAVDGSSESPVLDWLAAPKARR